MHNGISTVERAYQLARSGKYTTLPRLKSALDREGYFSWQISGPMLSRQLNMIMAAAQNAMTRPDRTVDKSLHQKIMR
jgi:hypothetical protein